MGDITMRCVACNAWLSDFESTRKSAITEEYLDLCNHCYYTIDGDVLALERTDLEHDEDTVLDFVDDNIMDIDLDSME
jgi:hypothetical protein